MVSSAELSVLQGTSVLSPLDFHDLPASLGSQMLPEFLKVGDVGPFPSRPQRLQSLGPERQPPSVGVPRPLSEQRSPGGGTCLLGPVGSGAFSTWSASEPETGVDEWAGEGNRK